MKNILLSMTLSIFGLSAAIAQTADTANTGAGYANDVYYSLKNSTVSSSANDIWHLGFQMVPLSGPNASVSVIANSNTNNVQVFSMQRSAYAHFNTFSAADTAGMMSTPLYNDTKDWAVGALNATRNLVNPFDYGWGLYDMASHNVLGDSLFVIRTGSAPNAKYYKFTISKYNSAPTDSIYYQFRMADLDGSSDTTIRIYRKDGFVNRGFAYFNLQTKTAHDRELTDLGTWDLLFTKYVDSVSQGPVSMMYKVTGVLSALNVQVAEESNIAPANAVYNSANLKSAKNMIGYDWKSFDNVSSTYIIDTNKNYFVKTVGVPSEIYQIWFTHFGGPVNGHVVFNKKYIGLATAVKEVANNVKSVNLVPNPASSGQFTLLLDAKETSQRAQVQIIDMSGRVVYQIPVKIAKGLNAFKFNQPLVSGNYIIHVGDQQSHVNVRLSVTE